jgi:WD40 repeat protein
MSLQAGATAAPDWRGPHLVGLVERLREAGFAVGTSELIDASQLLLEMARRSSAPLPAGRLRAALKPVLCKDSAKRADFDRVFDLWWALVASPAGETAVPAHADPEAAAAATPAGGPARPRGWRTAAGLLVLVALAAGVYWGGNWVLREPPPVLPAGPPSTAPAAGPAAAAPPASAPAPPVAAPTAAIEGYVPMLRQNAELRPAWAWAFALLPLLALLAFSLPALYIGRTRARRGGQPLLLDAAPLELEARRLVPPLSGAVADRLARHLRGQGLDLQRAVRRPRIDERRTVEATLRNRGVPTVRWAATPVHPSYLLLVDVARETDPRGRLFFQWALRLQQQGLAVDIQVLRRDPEGQPNSDPDALFFGPPGLAGAERTRWQPLHRLRTPPFGQRLIVVSDGAPLVDDSGRWRRGALRARLQRWPERALFTPLEMRDWGVREEALEQRQTPVDPGFTVLPLDESALASWTTLVLTGRLADITLAEPQRFPALLRRGRGERFLADEPPPATDVERLVVQLRLYLGEWGLRWMAALALAPVVRWELTLLLGRTALAMQPRLADERSLSEALALYYRRLVRLPWLQRASIPDWLRLRLLMELPRREQMALQDRVRQLFEKLAPRDGREGIALGFERPPLPGAAALPHGAEAPAEGDAIYLGTMSGLAAEDLLMRAPAGWERWAGRLPLPKPRGWRERLGLAGDRLRNAWARHAFVDGMPHLGARSSSRWLAPLLALPLAALLLWAGRQTVPEDSAELPPGFEHRVVPAVLAQQSAVGQAAFMGDGEGVLVASGGGRLASYDTRTGERFGPRWPADDSLSALALSPRGDFVAVVDADAGLILYDARDDRPLELAGADGLPPVTSLAFSIDGRWLLATAGSLLVWDLQDLSRPPLTVGDAGAAAPAAAAAAAADGWLAAPQDDGSVSVWPLGSPIGDTPRGERRVLAGASPLRNGPGPLRIGPGGAGRLAAGADARLLAELTHDGTLRRWRMPAGEPLGELRRATPGSRLAVVGVGDSARLLLVAPDGSSVELRDAVSGDVVGGDTIPFTTTDWELRDAASGNMVGGGPDAAAPVDCIAVSPDGERLALCSGAGLHLLQARAGRAVAPPLTAGDAQRRLEHVALSPDGERVAAIGRDGAPVLWSHATGQPLAAAAAGGHADAVYGIAFVDAGARLVTSGADGLRFWDGRNGEPLAAAFVPVAGGVWALAAAADGSGFVTVSVDGVVQRRDGAGVALDPPIRLSGARVTALAASADGGQALVGDAEGALRELQLRSQGGDDLGQPLGVLRELQLGSQAALGGEVRLGARIGAAAYSGDGRLIAAGTDDGRVHVWAAGAAGTASPRRSFEGHRTAVAAVGFDADGGRLVAVAQDGSIRLWDLASGRAVGSPLPGPVRPVGRPALSANGRAVAMAVVVQGTPAAAAAAATAPAAAPGVRPQVQALPPEPISASRVSVRAGATAARERLPATAMRSPPPEGDGDTSGGRALLPGDDGDTSDGRALLGEPVVVPMALTRSVVDQPPNPKAADAARNVAPVQQRRLPAAAEATKSGAAAQQQVVPQRADAPPATGRTTPPASSPTPGPAPELAPAPPPAQRHGVQRWRLDPPPDAPRPGGSALAARWPGTLPASVWWALGGAVFVLYAVHGVARAARLRRRLAWKGPR